MATADAVYDDTQTYNTDADWSYPSKENIAIFGPVLLPKVYGSNLSELEIASDGLISLTVNSQKAILIDEKTTNGEDFYMIEAQGKALELASTESKVMVLSETMEDVDDYSKHTTSQTKGFQFSNNVGVGGKLSVIGSADIKGSTRLHSNLSVNGDTAIEGATKLDSTLSVGGGSIVLGWDDDQVTRWGYEVVVGGGLSVGNGLKVEADVHIKEGALSVEGRVNSEGETEAANFEGVVRVASNLSVTTGADIEGFTRLGATLSVAGETEITGATTLLNNLTVKENTYIEKKLSVGTVALITGDLSAKKNVRIGSNLSVAEKAAIVGNMYLGSNLSVKGNVSVGLGLDVGLDIKVAGNLSVEEEVDIKGVTRIGSNLSVSHGALIGGATILKDLLSVHTTADIRGVTRIGSDLSVTGSTDIAGAVRIKETLSVMKDANFEKTVQMNKTLSVGEGATIVGATVLSNSLIVENATNLNSTLDVVGKATFLNDVEVESNTLLLGTLDVKQATQMESTLSVKGLTALGETTTDHTKVSGNLSVGVDTDIVGAVQIDKTLSVKGEVFYSDSLSVKGDVGIYGKVEINSNLSVKNDVKILGKTELDGTLSVTNQAGFENEVRIGSKLSVLNDVLMSNNLVVKETLSVGGAVLLASESNETVTGGDLLVGDKLSVRLETNFEKSAEIGSNLSVGEAAYVGTDAEIRSNVTIGLDTTIGSNLSVGGSSIFLGWSDEVVDDYPVRWDHEVVVGGGLSVGNGLLVEGDAILSNSVLSVYGRMNSEGEMEAANFEGVVRVASNLSVTTGADIEGFTRLGSTLSVAAETELLGDITLHSNISVGGPVFASSNLSVASTIFGEAKLSIGGTTTLSSATEIESTLNVESSTVLGSTLSVSGDTYIGGGAGATAGNGTVAQSASAQTISGPAVGGNAAELDTFDTFDDLDDTKVRLNSSYSGLRIRIKGTYQCTDINAQELTIGIYRGDVGSAGGHASFILTKDKMDLDEADNARDFFVGTYTETSTGASSADYYFDGTLTAAHDGQNWVDMPENAVSSYHQYNVGYASKFFCDDTSSESYTFSMAVNNGDFVLEEASAAIDYGYPVDVSASAYVTGALSVEGSSDIVGAAKLGSTLSVTGNTDIVGAARIDKTLSVKGNTDIVGAARIDKTLSVKGETDIIGATRIKGTLSVESAVKIDSTLAVDSHLTTGHYLSVGNFADIRGYLSVDGVATLSSNLIVQGPKMQVPKGSNDTRPVNGSMQGLIYYNEEAKQFQGLARKGNTGDPDVDNVWIPLGGYKGVNDFDGDTFIRAMDENGNDNDTISMFAGDSNQPKLILTNSNFDFNLEHNTNSASVKMNSALSVTGLAGFQNDVKITGKLSVMDDVKFNADVLAYGATKLGGILSVTKSAHFEKEIRMPTKNAGLMQVAQHADYTSYDFMNDYSNIGSIIYDEQRQIHMGLQGANDGRAWKPIGGMQDGDADTYISAEAGVGVDDDTLSFYADAVKLMSMSNDALRIHKTPGTNDGMLSVGGTTMLEGSVTMKSNVQINNTLSVGKDAKFNKEVTCANNVILNTTNETTTSILGELGCSNNVKVKAGKNLYAETVLASYLGHYDHYNGGGQGQAAGSLDMFYENVTIHGDLDIMGQINQSATNITELYVEDKSIVLGASSSSEVMSNADGSYSYTGSNYNTAEIDMHESGLTVSGVPGMFDTPAAKAAEASNVQWEKSLMWRVPGEANSDGTSNLAMTSKDDSKKHLEPFWEFKGGQLRITQHTENDDSEFVSFAFRINANQQLELVKLNSKSDNKIDSAGDFKTIAKFGNVVADSA